MSTNNGFILNAVEEHLAKLIEDKSEVDDKINSFQKELSRLLPIQKAMYKDIKEAEEFIAKSQKGKKAAPKGE